MARIRTIKPDFWTDEKVVELDYADRLLFIGMWNFADDQGYLDYSLKRIKMQVFPGDDIEVSRGLQRLHSLGLICLYESREGLVIHIVNWEKHQRVSNPSRARFTEGDLQECDWPVDGLASPLEPSRVLGKGREGKGREVLSSDTSDDDEPDLFAEFYDAYPRKEAKRKAEQAYRAALKRADHDTIMAGLARFPFSDDRKFVPLPASWLNADRWADETPPTQLRAVPDGPIARALAEGREYRPWLDY
jgi:hypothetical protein